jgi:hypothetical protein
MHQASSHSIFSRTSLLLSVAIVILAIITAWIHLQLAIRMGFFTSDVLVGKGSTRSGLAGLIFSHLALLFVLNGIGYIVLVVALYLPQLKRIQYIIRWILIAFTAITVIAYFALLGLHKNPTGYIDKIVEIALIALLLIEGRRATSISIAK